MTGEEKLTAIREKTERLTAISRMQEKINREIPVDGERIILPLKERKLEAVYYNRKKIKRPIVFAAFGGGFLLGGCALDNAMWTRLSREWDCQLVSVGYRKSTEAKYPSGIYDFYETICFFHDHPEEFQFDRDRIITYGSSAGGNIANGAAILDRDNGTSHIKTQILNYPYLDMVTDPEDKGHTAEELISCYVFPDLYIPRMEQRKDILASPRWAAEPDLKNLPSAIITTGANDAMRHEAVEYGKNLLSAGNDTRIREFSHMPHGFVEHYFSLHNRDFKKAFCPEDIKKCLEDGTLKTEAENAMTFIKENLGNLGLL